MKKSFHSLLVLISLACLLMPAQAVAQGSSGGSISLDAPVRDGAVPEAAASGGSEIEADTETTKEAAKGDEKIYDSIEPLSLDDPRVRTEPQDKKKENYIPIQTKPQDMTLIYEGKVTEIPRSTLIRVGDLNFFALDNIRVPIIYDLQALEYLQKSVLGKNVKVYANTNAPEGRKDRYGNTLAHIVLADDNKWVQGQMVGEGLAWADSSETNRDMVIPLLSLENDARGQELGFWSNPLFAVRYNNSIMKENNSFQVYEGLVKDVSAKRKTIFLNFGDAHEEDFTIRIDRAKIPNFGQLALAARQVFNVNRYKGKRVRVRGWVTQYDGPMMEITHPEQIEILSRGGKQEGILPAP